MASTWGSRRRRSIAAGIVAILALGVGAIAILGWWGSQGGPLAEVGTSAIAVDFPLGEGQVGTWGNVLPTNPTSDPITIEAIELIGVRGLEVLGMGINDPMREGGIGTAHGYPPPGVNVTPVTGVSLAPAGSENPHAQLLVGVERTGAEDGSIAGIRVRYRHGDTVYELTLPHTLEAFNPEP